MKPWASRSSRSKRLPTAIVLGILIPFGFVTELAAADPTSGNASIVDLHDHRPVQKAVEILESQSGIPITYEDPPYVYAGDLIDVATSVRKVPTGESISDYPPVWVPRGGQLQMTLPEGGVESTTEIQSALSRLFESGGTESISVKFDVLEEQGRLHVLPTEVRDKEGMPSRVTSILDTEISLPDFEDAKAILVLNAICEDLERKTGVRIGPGRIPLNPFGNIQVTLPASKGSARVLLQRLFEEMRLANAGRLNRPADEGGGFSWQLLYGPGLGFYALNIHVVNQQSLQPND